MKNPETQALRRALMKVRRQNNKEKAEILKPFLEKLDLSISSDMLFFSKDDPESIFPLPFDNIFGLQMDEDYLYLFCQNGYVHILGIRERGHLIQFLERKRPSVLEQFKYFLWSCFGKS